MTCECGKEARNLGLVPGHGNMISCPVCGQHVKDDRRPGGHRPLHEIMEKVKADSGSIADARIGSLGFQVEVKEVK